MTDPSCVRCRGLGWVKRFPTDQNGELCECNPGVPGPPARRATNDPRKHRRDGKGIRVPHTTAERR